MEVLASITIGIDPDFDIGSFSLSWHGMLTFVAVAVSVFLAVRWGTREGLVADSIYSVAVWGIIGGVVGARLIHIIDQWDDFYGPDPIRSGIPGYRARIRPIVSRITIHWPSFYNVVTGKTLALPNLIALQHIPLSPAGVIAKRPAPIALPNSCAAEWRMAPDAVFSPYASVRYFTPHMVHSQYNLL